MIGDVWHIGNRGAYLRGQQKLAFERDIEETKDGCRHKFVKVKCSGALSDSYDIMCHRCNFVKEKIGTRSSGGHQNIKGTANLKKAKVY